MSEVTDDEIFKAYDAATAQGGSADSAILRTCRALLAAPTPQEGEPVAHPIAQVEAWAGDYEKEGHALIAQMLRSYARLLATPQR